jgi:hypothetical protein
VCVFSYSCSQRRIAFQHDTWIQPPTQRSINLRVFVKRIHVGRHFEEFHFGICPTQSTSCDSTLPVRSSVERDFSVPKTCSDGNTQWLLPLCCLVKFRSKGMLIIGVEVWALAARTRRWRRIGWGHTERKLKRMSRSVMLHVLESNSWYASIVRVSIWFASDARMP